MILGGGAHCLVSALFELLSKLVKEYFQKSDIKEAKKILFTAAASNDRRKKIRQSPRYSEFNIKDIYELFQDLSNAGDNNLLFRLLNKVSSVVLKTSNP